ALTLTLGDSDNAVHEVRAPSAKAFTIDGGSGSDVISLMDVSGPAPQPAQTITVNSGAGADVVNFYAARPGDVTVLNDGDGADFVTLTGDRTKNGNADVTVNLGAGDDSAEVAGTQFIGSAKVKVNGDAGNDTLLFDAAGNAITAYDSTGTQIAGGQTALPD